MTEATSTVPPARRDTDFAADTAPRSAPQAARHFAARMRSGDLGSVPAVLGLVVLVAIFATSSSVFLSLTNIANLLSQSAGTMIIAMGLVFVLLTGEIDVAAGTGSGLTAAVLALHYVHNGNLVDGMGTGVFWMFAGVLGLAVVTSLVMRIWAAAVLSAVAIAITVLGFAANPWVEMLLAVSIGVSIGSLTGFMVARVKVPSFVITLALFLTWQGVILQFIGVGGVLGISTSPVLNAVANGNLSTTMGWAMFVVAAGGYAAVEIGTQRKRRSRKLGAQATALVIIKISAVVVLGALATALLNVNRSQNPNSTIEGVPYVVPIILVLLSAGTYVLNRTRYGRHVYAVGGGVEAARRAGIQVPKIKASVFVISSGFAAIGAIVYSSKVGSVDPSAGGLDTLLFAVGAAVIGGTSLFGGRGRISNAVLGGMVIAVVENGLGLLNQSAAVVSIVTGLILALAATVDALSRFRSRPS